MKNEEKKRWVVDVIEDPETNDAIIQFPEEFLDITKWKSGDTIRWIDNGDGSWTLQKVDPEKNEL